MRAKMMRTVLVTLAVILLPGCMSQRAMTTLESNPGAAESLSGLTFRVLQFQDEPPGGRSSSELQQRLQWRYPALFGSGPGAIPLVVRERRKSLRNESGMWLMVLTLFTVPAPMRSGSEVDLELIPWGDDAPLVPGASVGYRVVNEDWMTALSPLGLLPLPGRSDMPRRTAILPFVNENSSEFYNGARRKFALEVYDRALLTALSRLDAASLRKAAAARGMPGETEVELDGKPYRVRLAPVFDAPVQKGRGPDRYQLEFRAAAAAPNDAPYILPAARRGVDGAWQPERYYVMLSSRPMLASCLLENGKPARPAVWAPEQTPLADFMTLPGRAGEESAWLLRWSNGILLQLRHSTLPAELAARNPAELQQLTLALEGTLLDLSGRASQANDRAQRVIEQGASPEGWREVAMLLRQRSEILKAIMGMVRQEAATRGTP